MKGQSTQRSFYGLVLRAYPTWYRRLRGDEMISTYMDSRDEKRPRPWFKEVFSALKGALTIRLGTESAEVWPLPAWQSGIWWAMLLWIAGFAGHEFGTVDTLRVSGGGLSRLAATEVFSLLAIAAFSCLVLLGQELLARLFAVLAAIQILTFWGGFSRDAALLSVPFAVLFLLHFPRRHTTWLAPVAAALVAGVAVALGRLSDSAPLTDRAVGIVVAAGLVGVAIAVVLLGRGRSALTIIGFVFVGLLLMFALSWLTSESWDAVAWSLIAAVSYIGVLKLRTWIGKQGAIEQLETALGEVSDPSGRTGSRRHG